MCYNAKALNEKRIRCWCGSMAEQLICNQQVDGSTPFTSSNMGDFPSGQRGQTVNLLVFTFGGPNPPSPTNKKLLLSKDKRSFLNDVFRKRNVMSTSCVIFACGE